MKFLTTLLLALCFTGIGCTKSGTGGTPSPIGCSVETVITTAAAGAIAAADSCSNVSQIQQDIQAKLGSINVCSSASVQQQMADLKKKQGDKYKGIVGSIVCPLATDAILSLIGAKVPSSWGCQGSADVAAAISAACISVVPI